MGGFFSLLVLGFVFGLQHAFDADHIAAVAVLARDSGTKKHAFMRGAMWGLGHMFVLLAVGILVLILGLRIPPVVNFFCEFAVGILLIALGGKALIDYQYGAIVHSHPPFGIHAHRPSFFVGMLHGLAGSATLLVGIISIIQSPLRGLLYIIVFGIGSIIGMSLLGVMVGSVANIAKKYFSRAAGAFSLASGFFILLSRLW